MAKVDTEVTEPVAQSPDAAPGGAPGGAPEDPEAGHRAGRPGRWTPRGSGTLALGAALLGGGLWWQYPGMVGLGAGFVLLALLALLSVLLPAPLAVDRDVHPREVVRHGRCEGTLRVRHVGRGWPLHLDAVDHVGGELVPVAVPRLRAGGRGEVRYRIPTPRRGVLTVGPVLLRRRGLAGLASRTAVLGAPVEVRVLPRRHTLRAMPSGLRRGHVGTDERVDHGGTNLVGLREYVPGDDLRRLHWATSARTGTLMVREDADPARPHLAVLLDDRQASYRDPQTDFEDAVELAASLVHAAARNGYPARLRTVSGVVDAEVPASVGPPPAAALRAVSLVLADLQLTEHTAAPAPLPRRDRDVVAVISGSRADLATLAMAASGAALGVTLLVDTASAGRVEAAGAVFVLRGPRVTDLLGLWDRAVAP